MDWQKIGAYISAIVGNTLGILVATHNINDGTAQAVGVSIGAVLNAVAVIFASHTGNKK